MKRHHFLLGALALALTSATGTALAQNNASIRILVGFAAGGSSDMIARQLAQGLQQELGQPVVVDNKPSAGGNPKAGLKEFAQWAKGNPDRGNVGVPAPASAPDFAVGIVAKALDADLRSVPYRGDAPVAQDVMAGQISAGIGSVGAMLQPAKAGKVRIVAVNGTSRLALLPDVPTYAELGIKGYEEMIYTGLFAPAGLPADLVQRYSAALAKVVKSEVFAEKLSAMGISAASSSPAELAARVAHTHKDWTVMVKNAGYKAQ